MLFRACGKETRKRYNREQDEKPRPPSPIIASNPPTAPEQTIIGLGIIGVMMNDHIVIRDREEEAGCDLHWKIKCEQWETDTLVYQLEEDRIVETPPPSPTIFSPTIVPSPTTPSPTIPSPTIPFLTLPPPAVTPPFPTTPEEAIAHPGIKPAHLYSPFVTRTGPRAWTTPPVLRTHRSTARVPAHQWLSTKELEIDRYQAAKARLGKMAPGSPFVPTTLHSWISHRLEWLADEKSVAEERIALLSMLSHKTSKRSRNQVIGPALGGRIFLDNRSAVLGLETIWCSLEPDRPKAPWPPRSEYKWEGDSRARSGFRRFLPIPRALGNDTVVWHQKPAVYIPLLDRVGQPTHVRDEGTQCLEEEEASVLPCIFGSDY
ncbi:MAG: hypothetical protein M1839_001653 [Geoglossum umbratile]|nr:MAG: hypothetical protein M1839_001653 [Geoglossum umbratile]